MFTHLAFLANARHAYAYLLYVLLAVELNDVAAFTFGKLLGRHPLRSNISPRRPGRGRPELSRFRWPFPGRCGLRSLISSREN
jgi:hypothetical protein